MAPQSSGVSCVGKGGVLFLMSPVRLGVCTVVVLELWYLLCTCCQMTIIVGISILLQLLLETYCVEMILHVEDYYVLLHVQTCWFFPSRRQGGHETVMI